MVRKKFWKLSLILLISLAIFIGGWIGLRQYQISKSASQATAAIQDGRYDEAMGALNYLRSLDSNHPDLNLLSAQVYSRVYPLYSLPFWEQAIATDPGDGNIRIAYLLTLIKVGKIPAAREQLQRWPAESTGGADYHRAAFALEFADGNMAQAEVHARQLNQLEPDSELNEVNLLRIQVLDPQPAMRDQARRQLLEYRHNEKFRFHALQALLRSGLQEENTTWLAGLIGQLKAEADLSAEEILMMLDAGQRAGFSVDTDLLETAWEKSDVNIVEKSRVAGWMVQSGLGERLLTWVDDQQWPPDRVWDYPLGLALAEAYSQVGRPETALAALRRYHWQLEYLNRFTQAWLAMDSSSGEALLELAVKEASSHRGALAHLAETARSWRWRAGWVFVLREQLKSMDPDDPRFIKVMQVMEESSDAAGLYAGAVRYLDKYPHHAPSLNNAAYLASLLNQDNPQAVARARRAVALAPEVLEYRNTLAFTLIRAGDLSAAEQMIVAVNQQQLTGAGALVLALWNEAHQRPLPPEVHTALEAHSFALEAENVLKRRLLR